MANQNQMNQQGGKESQNQVPNQQNVNQNGRNLQEFPEETQPERKDPNEYEVSRANSKNREKASPDQSRNQATEDARRERGSKVNPTSKDSSGSASDSARDDHSY